MASALPVRAVRRPGRAARVGDRPRRGRAAVRLDRRRRPDRLPGAVVRVHGPAGQLLAVPAAGRRVAVAGGSRAPWPAAGLRARGAAGRGRDAVAQRRRPRAGDPGGHGALGPPPDARRLGRPAGASRPDPARRGRSAPSGCSCSPSPPGTLRQLAVFGQLSPSTSSGRVLFIRDISEWNSITIPATLDHLLGMGIGPLLVTRVGGFIAAAFIFSILRRRPGVRPVHGRRGVAPAARRAVRAVPRLRGPAVRVQRARLGGPRARRDVHPLGGGARAAWATCSPSRGSSPVPRGSPRGARGWDTTSAARVFVGGAVAFGVLTAVVGASAVHRSWDAKRQDMRAVAGGPRRGGRARDRPGDVDRRVRLSLLDRPPGRGAGQRPARHRRAGRPRVRHPLAGPRAQGQRGGRPRDPRRRPAAAVGRPADPQDRRRRRLPGLPRRRRSRAVRTGATGAVR